MATIEDIWKEFDLLVQGEVKTPVHTENYYLCSVCGGPKVFIPNDLPVCRDCGIVDNEFISEEAEWTSGAGEEDPSRCGGVIDEHFYSTQWSIGTKITTKYGDSAGRKMSRIHFHMSMNHKDRSLFHAYAEIDQICKTRLGLPENIIDEAKIRYREITQQKLTRGDVRKGVKANCVILACKRFGYPRTTREIAEAFDIDTKDIGRTSNIVEQTDAKKVIMPADIIARIFENMNCQLDDKQKKIRQCYKVCNTVERNAKLMGKTPSGIASAVIYIVLDDTVPKAEICKSAHISVPTLNKLETIIREILKS